MSGRIDVANYENQLLLASARKKLHEELKQNIEAGTPKQKAAASILTSKEMDLLNYVNDDFKKLLVIGTKRRSEKVIKQLEHVMSLSEAMKCVELGTGSYGGHIARSVKAPGPTNGHNIVRPHERIHSLDAFTAQETRNLVTTSKELQHAPFDTDPEGAALSVGRNTLNLHDFDADLRQNEKQFFVQEIDHFNRVLETRRRLKEDEKKKLQRSVTHLENTIKQNRILRRRSKQHNTVTGDSIGMRYPQFDSLLELPMPMESREVMYSDHYLRGKQEVVQAEAEQKAKEELEARKTGKMLRSEEEAMLDFGQSHTEEDVKRKRKRLWRFFSTKLHLCCDSVTTKELDDLACMVCPSELIANIVYYICIVLGITPEWHAAKRSIFKESNSFLSFLQAVNPLDIPERRLRKATAFKSESSVISNLTVQQAVKSCSMPVIEHLCNWVLNFDALANFIIVIEGRKKKSKFSDELQCSFYDPSASGSRSPLNSDSKTNKKRALSPKSSMSSIKDIMLPEAKRKALAVAMYERSKDLLAENKRHEELVQRASRKYKHSGLKIIDPHEVLKSKLNSPTASPEKKKPRIVTDYSQFHEPKGSSKPASPLKKKKQVKVSMKDVLDAAKLEAPTLVSRNSNSSSTRPGARSQSALSHFDAASLTVRSVTPLTQKSDVAPVGPACPSKKWELLDGSNDAWQKMAQAARLENVAFEEDEEIGHCSSNNQAPPHGTNSMEEGDDYADEFLNEDEVGETCPHHKYAPIRDDPVPAVNSTNPHAKSPSPAPGEQPEEPAQIAATKDGHDADEEESDTYNDAWD